MSVTRPCLCSTRTAQRLCICVFTVFTVLLVLTVGRSADATDFRVKKSHVPPVQRRVFSGMGSKGTPFYRGVDHDGGRRTFVFLAYMLGLSAGVTAGLRNIQLPARSVQRYFEKIDERGHPF
ncbi:hypothetical protein RI054_12g60550 [Pseudoscourfieldia marina]